ncbi:LysE family translocator [Sphingomonas abietis]|uniref:LysE family translocator n=1 Tax=Sphingomonas abietis TaxID=3012344 RepID=A0ABY7NGY4_9SPHN|nr:LysE family translocator [Sphingomonas abietis]WBO20749.1 LysE family translocator [Sphingomonas abietis]
MQAATLITLLSFCFVSSITPGPNNMMLLSSGATFGLRRTVPHILGISGGCAVMVLVLGWSVAGLSDRLPWLFVSLHIVSTAYLLWLAWRIATSTGLREDGRRSRPLTTLDAAAFQWVNPKAWAMVLGAVASFARTDHLVSDVPLIALVLALVGLPCIVTWAGSGSMLKAWLSRPIVLRRFNVAMALLLVASILPGIWQAVTRTA